jgi:hypothetical protein
LDLRHPEAFVLFADRARYEKRSSTAKGLLLGVFFSAEGPQDKGITGKVMLMILSTEGPRDEDIILEL